MEQAQTIISDPLGVMAIIMLTPAFFTGHICYWIMG